MLIPILLHEDSIQTNDLTRFDASKSIKVKGSAGAINAVTIKAGADAVAVNVFDAQDSEAWFLDWVFTGQSFDIGSTNNVLNFTFQGVDYRALVLSGTYSLASLLTQIKTTIEAAASPLTVTLTSDVNSRITITPSLPIVLLLNKEDACLFSKIGFYDGIVFTGLPVEYSFKEITLEVTTDLPETASLTKTIKVLTPNSDRLFSTDADLVIRERDILQWTASGRSSFLAEHRKTQTEILDWLFKEGYYDSSGKALTKWSIVDTKELRQWALYKTLAQLMFSFSNAADDVFIKKSEKYQKLEIDFRKIYSLTLDTDLDGVADASQDVGTSECTLVHR